MANHKLKKRHLYLCLAGVVSICLIFFLVPGCLITKLGGAFSHQPEEMEETLSAGSKTLLERVFANIDSSRLLDYHTHIVGKGDGGTGCFINENNLTWTHPWARFRFLVYVNAAGIKKTDADMDRAYVTRLVRLVGSVKGHGKHLVLALDKYHDNDGKPDHSRTEYYVPSEYAVKIASQHPDMFVPAVSIHPYRPDAISELNKWAERGIKIVKWIPNAMGIDPTDKRCEPFYEIMQKNNMTLLTHVGHEKAIEAEDDQKYGNPLLFRKPLDMGVKIIMAHAASLGENIDIDSPQKEPADNFDLFIRLMDEKRYEGLLFADISATTQFNRLPKPLITLLKRTDLHHRLVNGSDYPLPAVNMLIQLDSLEDLNLISKQEAAALKEIYDYNPLLFDFALKRTVKLEGTEQGFPPEVFMVDELLGV